MTGRYKSSSFNAAEKKEALGNNCSTQINSTAVQYFFFFSLQLFKSTYLCRGGK